uniref:Uncharacterized protein n=1 Tax=Eptatretus burgeri TaxID=7764 RepID=A0A8C4QMN2_EPTBU
YLSLFCLVSAPLTKVRERLECFGDFLFLSEEDVGRRVVKHGGRSLAAIFRVRTDIVKNGVACSPPEGVSVEAIVLAIGNIIGFGEDDRGGRIERAIHRPCTSPCPRQFAVWGAASYPLFGWFDETSPKSQNLPLLHVHNFSRTCGGLDAVTSRSISQQYLGSTHVPQQLRSSDSVQFLSLSGDAKPATPYQWIDGGMDARREAMDGSGWMDLWMGWRQEVDGRTKPMFVSHDFVHGVVTSVAEWKRVLTWQRENKERNERKNKSNFGTCRIGCDVQSTLCTKDSFTMPQQAKIHELSRLPSPLGWAATKLGECGCCGWRRCIA